MPHFGSNPPHTLDMMQGCQCWTLKLGNVVPKRLGTARQKSRALNPPPGASRDTDNFWANIQHMLAFEELCLRCSTTRQRHQVYCGACSPNTPRTITGPTLAEDGARYVTDILSNWCRQNNLITCRTSSTLVCKTRLLLLENTTIHEPWLRRVQQSLNL